MMLHSIETVVYAGDGYRDHLTLPARERSGPAHQMVIEFVVRFHGVGIEAVDLQDVIDTAPSASVTLVQLLKL